MGKLPKEKKLALLEKEKRQVEKVLHSAFLFSKKS